MRSMNSSRPPTNLTTTVVRGASIAGAGHLLTQALTLASYVVLARVAEPRDFGEFAAGSIFIGFGLLFAESGMLAALVHRRDRLQEAASTAVVATILAGLAMGLIGLALSPLIGLFFHSERIALVAAAVSGYLVLRQSIIVPDALMQRRFSFLRRGVLEPAAVVAFGITAVVACAQGLGVWGLVLGTYASGATQVILSWSLVRWRPEPKSVSIRMWRELVAYGKHVIAGEFVRRATAEMSTAFVGRFTGTTALGHFHYAYRVTASPLNALISSTSYVLFPAFARISDDEVRFRQAVLRALRWMSVVAFPASLMLFALGESLVVVVFGERWREAGYAVMAMCAYTAGHSLDSLGSEVFKAAGRPNLLPRMHLVGAALTAGFMAALLPFGLIGIAAAISLRSLGVAAYALRAIGKVLGLSSRSLIAEIWPPAVAALALAASVYPVERFLVDAERHEVLPALALLGAEAGLGLVVYLAVLTATAPTTARALASALRGAPAYLGQAAPPRSAAKPEAPAAARWTR
jgi:O-antigen/teichoic acid export membrane protein